MVLHLQAPLPVEITTWRELAMAILAQPNEFQAQNPKGLVEGRRFCVFDRFQPGSQKADAYLIGEGVE